MKDKALKLFCENHPNDLESVRFTVATDFDNNGFVIVSSKYEEQEYSFAELSQIKENSDV